MEDILIIRLPKSKSELEEMYDLRWRVLYEALGKPKGSEIDDLDKSKERITYFITLIDGIIVGGSRLHINERNEGIVEYISFENERYSRNLKHLLGHIEWYLISSGIQKIYVKIQKNYRKYLEELNYKQQKKDKKSYGKNEYILMSKMLPLSS